MFADAVPLKIKITRSNAPSASYSWTGDHDINQSTYQDQKERRSEARGCVPALATDGIVCARASAPRRVLSCTVAPGAQRSSNTLALAAAAVSLGPLWAVTKRSAQEPTIGNPVSPPNRKKHDMEPQDLVELMAKLLDAELANFSEARDALLAEVSVAVADLERISHALHPCAAPALLQVEGREQPRPHGGAQNHIYSLRNSPGQ